MSLNIPIILGTNRPGNKSQHAAKFILEVIKKREDIDSFIVTIDDLNLPYDGNDEGSHDPKYTKITKEADAFFVVSPEYNHSYPATLKRILDSELDNYIHKPVTVAGVSSGGWGGTRVAEHLAPYLRELGLVYIFGNVYFTRSYDTFDDDGKLVIDAEKYEASVNKQLDELVWMAKALKQAREQ